MTFFLVSHLFSRWQGLFIKSDARVGVSGIVSKAHSYTQSGALRSRVWGPPATAADVLEGRPPVPVQWLSSLERAWELAGG